MIEIVCYMGGTCGDLIAALIDSKKVRFNIPFRTVLHDPLRCKLKKPHLFADDVEKDQYIDNIETHYKSIPSHDIEYHHKRQHNFIGITVKDTETAMWAAERFKRAHQPHVWEEMKIACGADSVNDYAQMMIDFSNLTKQYTDRIITLESIRNGQVLDEMTNNLNINTVDQTIKNLYNNWLELQRGTFVI